MSGSRPYRHFKFVGFILCVGGWLSIRIDVGLFWLSPNWIGGKLFILMGLRVALSSLANFLYVWKPLQFAGCGPWRRAHVARISSGFVQYVQRFGDLFHISHIVDYKHNKLSCVHTLSLGRNLAPHNIYFCSQEGRDGEKNASVAIKQRKITISS